MYLKKFTSCCQVLKRSTQKDVHHSGPGRGCVTTLGKLFTPNCLDADTLRYYMASINSTRYLCTVNRIYREPNWRWFLWPGGVVVRAFDLRLRRSWVRFPALRFHVTTLGKLFTHTRTCVVKQFNLVPVKRRWCSAAGEVTVGLASHWPCVIDFSGLSTYGLTAQERELSTPPTLLTGYGTLCLYRTSWPMQRCPRVALTHGLCWVEIFQFLLGCVGSTMAEVVTI